MIDDDSKGLECFEHIQFKPINTDLDAVYERVQYRIWKEEHRRVRVGVSRWWKYTSVAVSIAFLLFVSYRYFYHPKVGVYKEALKSVVYIETLALPGTKTCITLPDSSKVWLNSMASLRYPQQFPDSCRMVELEGEALFDIKEDPSNPFIVSADGIRIEVTGTVFNVYSGLFPGCTEVTLIEGSVNLYKDVNETQHADQILEANQQAIYDKALGVIRVSEVNAPSFASWVTREFVFEKTSMEDIARELGRAFNVKIHINNDSIRKIHLNARFTHQESLDKILSILQIPANYIMYRKEDGEIYIR
jgi:ferric-dicitrate binding protein FerR (iron transport regulator)